MNDWVGIGIPVPPMINATSSRYDTSSVILFTADTNVEVISGAAADRTTVASSATAGERNPQRIISSFLTVACAS
jgi:hypothetical protein